MGQNQYLSELIAGTWIPSGCTGLADNTYHFFPFHFSKYLFHLIPLIVFVIWIICYFTLFPFVFSDTLAGFPVAVLLVFYVRISRNDSPAIGAFNHWLHGVFYHKDKNVYLDYCRRIISEKEVKRLRFGRR